jgi:hypothetical protein
MRLADTIELDARKREGYRIPDYQCDIYARVFFAQQMRFAVDWTRAAEEATNEALPRRA